MCEKHVCLVIVKTARSVTQYIKLFDEALNHSTDYFEWIRMLYSWTNNTNIAHHVVYLTIIYLLARHYSLLDPRDVVANFCVHSRLVSQSTSMTPRHNSLEFSLAHQWAPGVTLKTQKRRQSSLVHPTHHDAKKGTMLTSLPDRSPFLPPDNQRRSCSQ